MREIAVLVARPGARIGSAKLRGEQLALLCQQAVAGTGHTARLRFHDEPIADALVIVNKTVLRPPFHESLARLRAAGCLLVLDFLDSAVRPALAEQAHAFLACSRAQAGHLRAQWPDRPVVELPHHADLAVPESEPPWDGWRCGYFGSPPNALHLEALVAAGLVRAWETPQGGGNGWRTAAAEHNLHYAVRPRSMWGAGFKPFTKGMLAARVGAAVVVDASDEEAMALLGPDYPFVTPPDCDAPRLIGLLEEMRRDFGGPRWQLARQRMAPLRGIGGAAHQVALLRAALLGEGPLARWLRGEAGVGRAG